MTFLQYFTHGNAFRTFLEAQNRVACACSWRPPRCPLGPSSRVVQLSLVFSPCSSAHLFFGDRWQIMPNEAPEAKEQNMK